MSTPVQDHRRSFCDDAFVDAHVVSVSPRVASYVARVLVDDNTHVNMGQLIVELDPRDLQAKLSEARANLAAAKVQHSAASINAISLTNCCGDVPCETKRRSAPRSASWSVCG